MRFDWSTLKRHVFDDVARLEGLMTETLERSGVTLSPERATIAGPNRVRIGNGTTVEASKILIAKGSRPQRLGILGGELPFTSNEAIHLDDIPRRITIIAGGYIANEFAGIFAQFGATATIICRSPDLMAYDHSLRDRLLSISVGEGIRIHTSTITTAFGRAADGPILTHTREQTRSQPIWPCSLSVAYPASRGLDWRKPALPLGPEAKSSSTTNIGRAFPRSSRLAFADTQFGDRPLQVRYDCIPCGVFSNPPIAAVGLTEQQARDRFIDVTVTPRTSARFATRSHSASKTPCTR